MWSRMLFQLLKNKFSFYYSVFWIFFLTNERDVLDTTLCDKVCQWLATGQWFSLGTTFSSTNKTDHHDITDFECTYIFYIIFFSPYFWHHKFLKETLHDIVKLKRDFQKGNIIRMKTWCKWVRNLPAGWFMVFDAHEHLTFIVLWTKVYMLFINKICLNQLL
jgi:hypothetical protein